MLVPGVVVAQEETPVVIGEGVLDVVTTYLTQPDADLLAEGVQLYTPYWQTPLEGIEEVYGYDQGFYYDTPPSSGVFGFDGLRSRQGWA